MMKRLFYPAIFTKEGSLYWVRFPDLDGCFTQGETIEEAYENAQEAVGLWMDNGNGEFNPPQASDLSEIHVSENESIVLIEFDPVDYLKRTGSQSVKKTLTIPAWLNTLGEQNNINFSKLLQNALKDKLNVS